MARKQRKNKAKVFRIDRSRAKDYNSRVEAGRAGTHSLHDTIERVAALISVAHPTAHKDAEASLDALLQRWIAVLPHRLVGRDADAVFAYMDLMHEAVEACSLDMLDCEERLADAAEKRRRAAGP